MGLSDPYFGSIFDKIQVSHKRLKTLSEHYPVSTNLKHPHPSFRPLLPRQINCMTDCN